MKSVPYTRILIVILSTFFFFSCSKDKDKEDEVAPDNIHYLSFILNGKQHEYYDPSRTSNQYSVFSYTEGYHVANPQDTIVGKIRLDAKVPGGQKEVSLTFSLPFKVADLINAKDSIIGQQLSPTSTTPNTPFTAEITFYDLDANQEYVITPGITDKSLQYFRFTEMNITTHETVTFIDAEGDFKLMLKRKDGQHVLPLTEGKFEFSSQLPPK